MLLSSFAFKFNLRRYTTELVWQEADFEKLDAL